MGPRTPDSSFNVEGCKFAELAGASIADSVMCGYSSESIPATVASLRLQGASWHPFDTL
jgi:hypothetical protein